MNSFVCRCTRLILSLSFYIFLSHENCAQTNVEIIQSDHKFGLVQKGDTLISPQYDNIGWSNGLQIPFNNVVGYHKEQWGLTTIDHKVITAPKYYTLQPVHRNLIVASIRGRLSNRLIYGVINTKGITLISFNYAYLSPKNGLLIAAELTRNKYQYGLISETGETILPLKYVDIKALNKHLFLVENQSYKKAIVNNKGQLLTTETFDEVAPLDDDHFLITKNGSVGLVDKKGKKILDTKYKSINSETLSPKGFKTFKITSLSKTFNKNISCDSIEFLGTEYFVVHKNHYLSIVDKNLKVILEDKNIKTVERFGDRMFICQSDSLTFFYGKNGELIGSPFEQYKVDKNYFYGKNKGRWKIYDQNGTSISYEKIDDVLAGSEDLIPIKKKNHWGYLNKSGNIAVPVKYDKVGIFEGKIASATFLGNKGIIDKFGVWSGNETYQQISIQSVSMTLAHNTNGSDLIDSMGYVLFNSPYRLTSHALGYLEYTDYETYGLISKTGERLIDRNYNAISEIISGKYLILHQGNSVGLWCYPGRWVIEMTSEYEDIVHVSEGKIGIKKDGFYGHIDFNKKLRIANRYEYVRKFSNGLSAIKIKGKWGYIDEDEKLVVQPVYDSIADFESNYALVKKKGLCGLMNVKGKLQIPCIYERLYYISAQLLIAEKDSKYALYNEDGRKILPLAFEQITAIGEEKFMVNRRSLFGIVDRNGNYIVPLVYKSIIPVFEDKYLCEEN